MAHVPCRFQREHILRRSEAKGHFRKFANRLHMVLAKLKISKFRRLQPAARSAHKSLPDCAIDNGSGLL
ncbi:hypothetical protein [Leisingera sp. ANG-M1]|uniref:hypothetical protein n=1 Tax=Leisingera sp. ANG-M1 TaxID=1577895 RepID=UPI0019D36BED|nr:hypothetical protein [Leisingera sp. ANG-M1]